MSSATIIDQSRMRANEVRTLAVDIEGFVINIQLTSFEVPGPEPDLLVFELKLGMKLFPKESDQVIFTLYKRGSVRNYHFKDVIDPLGR